jgi:hypothetical protein
LENLLRKGCHYRRVSDHAARRGTDRVRPRLLLVEDDSNLAELLMDLLDDAGFQVDHVSDG